MQKRIIVVEDDPSIAEVLSIILKGEQYRVESFTDNRFVSGLAEDMPGLILLDLWLPGVNGKDICLQLKNDNRFSQIPVIIMSANRDIIRFAKEACANDYLAKPFNINDLLLLVKKYMI